MTPRKLCVLAWLFCCSALLPCRSVDAAGRAEALIVVAAPSFPSQDISYAALKSAFRGQRVEIGGKAVLPINHPLLSPARVAFDRIILGLEPNDVDRFWVDMRIRDQARPPTAASSPEIALRVVAALAGSLTYTTQSALTAKPVLKVLTVDGKAAGQSGYQLQP